MVEPTMDNGIRVATSAEECRAAFRLRYRCYVLMMRCFVEHGNAVSQELQDDYDRMARIVVAIEQQQAIGTLRLLWGGDGVFDEHLRVLYRLNRFVPHVPITRVCVVERLVVDGRYRGSQLLLRLFKKTLAFVLAHEIELLLMHVAPAQLKTYRRLGCVVIGRPLQYPGMGRVIPMALIVGDYRHRQRIASPLALLADAEAFGYCQHTQRLQALLQSPRHLRYRSPRHCSMPVAVEVSA
jgi:predicted GNAT family N-acyltransferase